MDNDFVIKKGVLLKYEGSDQDVEIPDGVKSIGSGPFSECRSLRSVIIPEGVKSIDFGAFDYCETLKMVTLPSSIEYIGEYAFLGCDGLEDFTINSDSKLRIKQNIFGRYFPSGLISQVGKIEPFMTDAVLKRYILEKNTWQEIAEDAKAALILNRFNRNLLSSFMECIKIDEVENLGRGILNLLSSAAPETDCAGVRLFLRTYSDSLSKPLMQQIEERLKELKAGKRALKQPKIQQGPSLPGQKVKSILKNDKALESIEKDLKYNYSVSLSKLPSITDCEGNNVEPFVFGWLLLKPGKMDFAKYFDFVDISDLDDKDFYEYLRYAEEHGSKRPPLKVVFSQETENVLEMLDQVSFAKALKELADYSLGTKSFSKRTNLLFPICRYADEELMKYLIKKAADLRKVLTVRGAKFAALKLSALYNDTRTAMMYAEKNGNLRVYALVRKMSEADIRDKYMCDFGLDSDGGKEYDLGGQSVKIQLQNDLTFLVQHSDSGKLSKTIPRKGSDPDKYQEALEDFKEQKNYVKALAKKQKDTLLREFVKGIQNEADIWKKTYLNNAVLCTIAGMFVWGQDNHYFTLADKNAIDCYGNPFEITNNRIYLAHPMEMSAAEVEQWRNMFINKAIKQPFAQIWEPVYNPEEIKSNRYSGCSVWFKYLINRQNHGIDALIRDTYEREDYILLNECKLDYSVEEYDIDALLETKAILGEFSFQKFTRQVNHIVYYLDKLTVFGRIEKDDITIQDVISNATYAQILEYIQSANKNNAKNCMAILLDEKNRRWPEYRGIESLLLE